VIPIESAASRPELVTAHRVESHRVPSGVALILSCGLAVSACASGVPASGARRVPSGTVRQAEPSQALSDSSWAFVRLRRFALVVPIPERSEWRLDDASTPWFAARHSGTGSELLVRTWSAPRLVTPEACEAQARLWLPELPSTEGEMAVERRALRAPAGFHGNVVAGVGVPGPKGELDGYAQVFGAAVGRCYAAVFTTRASGVGAELRLGRTLGVVVGGIFERMQASGIDDRASRPEYPFERTQ
jgi:hypothetical protein